jgi:acyl carrier protein
MSDLQVSIAEFIAARVGKASISPTASLIESGLVDSLIVLEVVGHLEAEFGVEFTPEHITLENFETVVAIESLLNRQRAASA